MKSYSETKIHSLETNHTCTKKHFKYLTLLIVIYCSFLCISDVMIERIAIIGNFPMSCSSLLIPITYILSDIVTEVYGYENTRKLIWYGVIATFIFSVTGELLNQLPIPTFWHLQSQYNTVLSPLLRNMVAYTVSSLGGLFLNAYVLSKWKILTKGKFFIFRSISSSLIGEVISVGIGFSILFIGVLPWNKLLMLMGASIIIKVIVNIISVWPGAIIMTFLKRAEPYDPYDKGISFNPFKIGPKSETPLAHQ